jgi:hypothetical protein
MFEPLSYCWSKLQSPDNHGLKHGLFELLSTSMRLVERSWLLRKPVVDFIPDTAVGMSEKIRRSTLLRSLQLPRGSYSRRAPPVRLRGVIPGEFRTRIETQQVSAAASRFPGIPLE